ncbi:hypothetical protein KR009_008801 [Drosophila setifemur]|nr:hypothetical protein KR009_008801 [Drosophila setifemur]
MNLFRLRLFQICLAINLLTFSQVESLDLIEKVEAIYGLSEDLLSSLKGEVTVSGANASIYPTSCLSTGDANGVHTLKLPGLPPFAVYCENELASPGWIVIQRRFNGSLSFFRNWEDYKEGFGKLRGEFFIGLEKIRAIVAIEPHELYIHLQDFDGEERHAKFDEFAIGSEEDDYAMNVLGKYTGTAGDSLRSHRKMKFSTYDRDNDREFNKNCAFTYPGGWWYNACLDR